MRLQNLLPASLFLLTLGGCASTQQASRPGHAAPPVARTVAVVDREFGLALPDPYRWMEGEDNAEFEAWLKAQGADTRKRLDALPGDAAWQARLVDVAGATTVHRRFVQVGERLFVKRAEAGREALLLVREADGSERVLLDPTTLEGEASLSGYSVSPAGDKVAVNIGFGGNEIGEIAVYDVASGARIDTLKPVWSEFQANWLPDGSGFFYTRMRDVGAGDPDPLQGMAAYLHRLGQPQSADRLLARAGAGDALAIPANDFPSVQTTRGSDWALLAISGARASWRICVAPLADATAARANWRCIVDDPDNIQGADLRGDTLYLLAADAPNRRVLALDLAAPAPTLAKAREVVPERVGIVLSDLAVARDGLYLKSMQQGIDRLERLDPAGGTPVALTPPREGSIWETSADPRQDGLLLSLENWTTPDRIFRYDGASFIDTGLGTWNAPAYPELVSERIEATSDDGTRVPMSVVRRGDLAHDGQALALVSGYGGYGISIQPFYSALLLEWVRAGHVYATCHVRGGGENGDAWRLAGSGMNKQRGIEDFTACARELARRGYSTPARTAGTGGSMGGVLTGGAYTTAPDAWGAMVIEVGLLNPVRLLAAKNGANQVAELGDPRTETGLKQLLAMDPYQHVRDGVRYPPLLLVTGLADQRVAPWNSGKFGARVRAASPATPVWFRTEEASGHFATSGNAAAIQYADIYAWLEATLGGTPAR
ncbi:MAG: S9 family peptidase [Xanthomonadales bacterium]|nr:S9 family peptidase [Xanthomonadales bacterium]